MQSPHSNAHLPAHQAVSTTAVKNPLVAGLVNRCTGCSKKPEHYNLFQVADVDIGVIRWVNPELAAHSIPNC
jgi:hypothetical protein